MSPSSLTTSTTRRLLKSSFQEESRDKETEPSYLRDADIDDETIRKALSSPLFTQEREESADRRHAYHSYEESLLPAHSFFAHSRTQRPVHELSSLSSCRDEPSREMENETIRILLERQKSKFSLKLEPRFKNTNFRPIITEEVSRNWMELLSLNEERSIIPLQRMNNFDEINCFFMNNNHNKIGIFVKLKWKVLMGWSNWSDLKGLDSMNSRDEECLRIKTLLMNTQAEM